MNIPPDGPSNEAPSDKTLLRDVRDGSQAAAIELYERYASRLHGLANRQLARETSGRLDSEDVTQSVFRTLFRRLQDGQYDVPAGDTIWRLLSTIALNKVRSLGAHHRAAKRDVRRTSSVDGPTLAATAAADDDIAAHELRLTIGSLLEDLGKSEQQIIQLRLEGHDLASIAAISKRSKRTVERILQGFRAILRESLEEDS